MSNDEATNQEPMMKTQFCQVVGFFTVIFAVVLVQAGEVRDEESRVLRINVPKLAGGEHDVQFVLFSREGSFHHGYALTPSRDNLPHRVDVTPAPPIQFVNKGGKPIDVEEGAIGYYSYKNKHFLKYREQFNKGEIRVAHPNAPKPLKYVGGKLSGAVDVLLLTPDESNTPGRNGHNLVYRVVLNGRGKGGQVTGSFEAWTYEEADNDYGAENERVKGEFTAHWDGDRVTGEATVIFHDDEYYSLNFEQGTAVAATYTIDCRARGDETTGSHTGTIGVAWSRSGPASGVLHPELTPGHGR
jgi:hypothetical protein